MEKTATLNLRINPVVKERAEEVLSQLGIPMSTVINMYLNQISLTGGIPFPVSLPKAPVSVSADAMTAFYTIQKDKVIVTNLLYSVTNIEERLEGQE